MTDRHEQLRLAIQARLERVRGLMSDEEFAHLVEDVTSTAGRLEEIELRGREGSRTPPPNTISAPTHADLRG